MIATLRATALLAALSLGTWSQAGQAEGELQRHGYEYRSGSASGNSKYSSWYSRTNGRCVMIRTEEGRYRSIVDAPMADCERR